MDRLRSQLYLHGVAAVPFRPRSHLCDSRAEESASLITHALGVLFSIVSLVVMILVSGTDPLRIVASCIFGATLILLYTSSTIYHSVSNPGLRSLFQIFDHSCIYLLIAGTYTPLTLITLRGPWGWSIFGTVWALAIAGVTLKSVMRENREAWWSTALYVVMGWLIVIAIVPLVRNLPGPGLAWLVAGGLCYTFGVIFFAWRRLPFNHAIWHLFVIAGSACHVIATVRYILP
ncbi:PAQR family membrane homeostasis protein TrhA [Haloferula sp.]|uniref:PAQR family membrane homeostasis protein TrhA n=1 Tax=Haloferula sp. TaxID=2497595 RepID=UPI00329BFB33